MDLTECRELLEEQCGVLYYLIKDLFNPFIF